jgi:hypothetical protein
VGLVGETVLATAFVAPIHSSCFLLVASYEQNSNEPFMTSRDERRAMIRYLREVEGLTFAVIGQRLGMTYEGARQIYLRAIRPKPRKPRRKPIKYQE